MSEADVETVRKDPATPVQSAFEISGEGFSIKTQNPTTNPSEKTSPKTEEETDEVLDKNYRPYCGEGHGKMIPSKFGGFWCPHCRR